MDESETVEKLNKSISILNRTRESLVASARPDSRGQLLDQALAKQLAVRRAELDSLLPKNISVIQFRSSTPDPQVSCENHFFSHHQPETNLNLLVPVNLSLPTHNYLDNLENSTEAPPPLLPRHPVLRIRASSAGGAPVNVSAPEVPWTPPRPSIICERSTLNHSSLLDLLDSGETAPLLAPLFTTVQEPSEAKVKAEIMEQAKLNCEDKIRKLNRLLRRYEPDDCTPSVVQNHMLVWTADVSTALDDMVDSIERMSIEHGRTLGSAEVGVWKEKITRGEQGFKEFVHKVDQKAGNQNQPFPGDGSLRSSVPAPGSTPGNYDSSLALRSAKADIEIDADIISTEGKKLAAEIHKFDDWGEAENEEIEETMHRIEDWKKRFAKIQEKGWAMRRNVKKFGLDERQLTISMALINTLESEMNLAVDNIKFENEERCLYSLSKSNTSSVKLPVFSGGDEEDFIKFRREMEKGFRSNRVKKEDQVKKLRENLRGQPKSLVPEGMDNIDNAWEILQNLYGDVSRIMRARKKKISALGQFPKGGKGSILMKSQAVYFLPE